MFASKHCSFACLLLVFSSFACGDDAAPEQSADAGDASVEISFEIDEDPDGESIPNDLGDGGDTGPDVLEPDAGAVRGPDYSWLPPLAIIVALAVLALVLIPIRRRAREKGHLLELRPP